MSQFFLNTMAGPIPPTVVLTLTGNNAVPVSPTAGNINIIGANGINIVGNAGTSTLTVSPLTPVFSGIATTTGNSTANINTTIPIPTNSTTSFRANIAGYDSTANLGVSGELLGGVKNVAGVLSIVGLTVDRTNNNDPPLGDVSWTLVISGTNVFVQVKGSASGGGADTINWRALIETVTAP